MYRIKKVAVLGAGVMGSQIALHLAGCGFQVVLLDIGNPSAQTESVSTEVVKNQLKTH